VIRTKDKVKCGSKNTVTLHQADRTTSPSTDHSPEKPFIGVLPFCHYVCEFTPREVSHGTWTICHRDSDEQAYITAGYRDLRSSEFVWRVETTLCAGTAEFTSHLTAERFVATMLRRNAGRKHHGGEPRFCFSFCEFWWSMKSEFFRRNRHGRDSLNSFEASRLTQPVMRAATRMTEIVGRSIGWVIKETRRLLRTNCTRHHSRQ